MKKPLSFVSKYILLMSSAVLLLSACGDKLESPEKVMKKAKAAITDVESGRVKVKASAEGQNGTDDLNFDGGMELVFDSRDEEAKKTDLHLMFSGDMKAGEKALSGEFDFNLITLAQDYYVKLNKLTTSDETLVAMEPFIEMYKGKWLKVDDEFVPEDIRGLQSEDEEAKLKREQMKELFRETTLFDVVKEYGVEQLNGEKVYHYGIRPNMEGFKDYMTKSAIIDGRELTAQEVEEAVTVLNYLKNAELYIDTDDYYVLKSILVFSGQALDEGSDANLDVEIVIEASDYNRSVSVVAPEGAEDFNPLTLMMGFGGAPALTEDDLMMGGEPGGMEVVDSVDDTMVTEETTEQ